MDISTSFLRVIFRVANYFWESIYIIFIFVGAGFSTYDYGKLCNKLLKFSPHVEYLFIEHNERGITFFILNYEVNIRYPFPDNAVRWRC